MTSAAVGALVRQARIGAGLSQTELGERIGASRFWVAQFEKGKPSAELGLALRAIDALGLTVLIEPKGKKTGARKDGMQQKAGQTELDKVLARTMLPGVVQSSVVGWPTIAVVPRRGGKS